MRNPFRTEAEAFRFVWLTIIYFALIVVASVINTWLGVAVFIAETAIVCWWFLTRAGSHGENSESSYLPPTAAWSHFLGHAYLTHDPQSDLALWLDDAWAVGDLYSIQKIVATIEAAP